VQVWLQKVINEQILHPINPEALPDRFKASEIDYSTDVMRPGPGQCKWGQPATAMSQFWYDRELAYAAGSAGEKYHG
jgi:hypothetical protein